MFIANAKRGSHLDGRRCGGWAGGGGRVVRDVHHERQARLPTPTVARCAEAVCHPAGVGRPTPGIGNTSLEALTASRQNGLLLAMGSAKAAVYYLRVSGLGQVEGDGFRRQREAIAARAKVLG